MVFLNTILVTKVLLLKVKTAFSKYLGKLQFFFCSKPYSYTLSELAESAETTDQWIQVAFRKIFRCTGLADAAELGYMAV